MGAPNSGLFSMASSMAGSALVARGGEARSLDRPCQKPVILSKARLECRDHSILPSTGSTFSTVRLSTLARRCSTATFPRVAVLATAGSPADSGDSGGLASQAASWSTTASWP